MPPRRLKIDPRLDRNKNSEKKIASVLMDDFDIKGSKGKALLEEIFQQDLKNISQSGLKVFGELVGKLINVNLTRNEKRRKGLIVKWFNDNASKIEPIKSTIKVDFIDLNQIKEIGLTNDDLDEPIESSEFDF
ncbi:hypothetical protein M9Y10_032515 [Tritrichomonas musculus]|uniref:Uncharacterized protein n=1 Tax=Tritrichomonas musculus TaxID=1915356 RepID=A0ABR2GYN0_9EUKA